jgi:hypothetical protein
MPWLFDMMGHLTLYLGNGSKAQKIMLGALENLRYSFDLAFVKYAYFGCMLNMLQPAYSETRIMRSKTPPSMVCHPHAFMTSQSLQNIALC